MSIRMNRQNWTDIIESGKYIVDETDSVFIGQPLRYKGSTSGSGAPAYTKYMRVQGYTDTTSVERCLGVSEDQIILGSGAAFQALRNLEWRWIRRDVAVCLHGDREMINMESGYDAAPNDLVAPYPGGFVAYQTGMCILGKVKSGPIAFAQRGMIAIDVQYYNATAAHWP